MSLARTVRRLAAGPLVALGVAALMTPSAGAAPSHPAAETSALVAVQQNHLKETTRAFRGVNWADPRDNYASDAVVPTGLSTKDSYRQTYRKAKVITKGFHKTLKANTIRLPINPSSVGTTWWKSYQGAIDASTDSGFKVILGYWEADDAKDGKIDDVTKYNAMWDTVVKKYGKNPKVFFEPMNEPFGYSLDDWVSTTSRWLSRHYDVPRDRVIISGTGYNDNVTGVGAAPELRGTLLSLHFYGYWADDTEKAAWLANLTPRIGSYGWRTIIDEAGSPMSTGLNYGNHDGNVSTAYLAALTETARAQHMGVVYWPGLRKDDAYSLTELDGSRLHVTNKSGLAQVQYGWGLLRKEPTNDRPAAPPGEPLRGVASDKCLDVPGFSTTNGTALDVWDCNGGGNQSWDVASGEIKIYGTQCLTAGGDQPGAGTPAVIADCSQTPDQKWSLTEDGTVINPTYLGLCLTTAGTAGGSAVTLESCTSSATSQQWTRT